jgi:ATP-dependent exoDNAse (exonuclease V) alpha subunit
LKKIALCAPTNKATTVLKKTVEAKGATYRTIYSILGLKMMADGAFKELTDTGKDKVSNYDLIVIDEGSMVSTQLLDYLESKIALSDTKVVIIGDKEQLPPVGEAVSPIWKHYKIDYELTEVMRHQNSILDFVQHVRKNPSPKFVSTGAQVEIETDTGFMEQIEIDAKSGKFHSGETKAIAWRNITVDFLNQFVREQFRGNVSTDKFVVGDRVIFRSPVMMGEVTLAAVDQEGVVNKVTITTHNEYPMLKVWRIGVTLDDDGTQVTANIIHDSAVSAMNLMLNDLSTNKKWFQFWKLKEALHDVTHAYALTAHRSQGSTFPSVFVEAGDINLNKNTVERVKCLYVACSRASKRLVVFP